MSGQVVRQLVAVFLVSVCPSTLLMAERPGAMLYANGAVMLNGMPAARTMSVFAGDRIDTADASQVSVFRTGLSLVINSNSSVQYQTDGFTVLKGAASARTSKEMAARVGPVSVIANDASALFDVKSDGKTIFVSSREGVITVTDGVKMATVAPGFTAMISYAPQDAPALPATASGQYPNPSQTPSPQASAGGQEEGPKPAATTRGDQDHDKRKLIIVIVLTAAAAAAIVCAIECGGGGPIPVSPVTP